MTTPHLDALTVAMLAEGRVKRQELPPLLAHLERCPRCSDALAIASEVAAEQPAAASARSPKTWLMALAAVLAVLAVTAPLLRQHDRGLEQLVALAPRSARVAAPRLSGGFAWAAYRGPVRATGDDDAETARLRLGGAAADAIDRANRERTPAAEHEAALALLLIEKPLDAETRLVRALQTNGKDATLWSDLAAARCAAADQHGRPSLLPRALAAADRAVELDPRLAEALFNRALIVERMGLTTEARAAWEAYLAVDPASPWANEAREHLQTLTTPRSQWDRERPRLERAAESGDATTVAAIVTAHPQNARAWGETMYLGQWGMAVTAGRHDEARRMLTIARAIGAALAARTRESLLRDSVRTIDKAEASSSTASPKLTSSTSPGAAPTTSKSPPRRNAICAPPRNVSAPPRWPWPRAISPPTPATTRVASAPRARSWQSCLPRLPKRTPHFGRRFAGSRRSATWSTATGMRRCRSSRTEARSSAASASAVMRRSSQRCWPTLWPPSAATTKRGPHAFARSRR